MVVYRVGEYSRRAGGFAGGYGASLTNLLVVRYSLQPADDITRLVTVKLSPSRRWRKVCLLRFGTIPLFDGYSTSDISNTMTDPGVGVIVTIVALICTITLSRFSGGWCAGRKARRCGLYATLPV